MRTKDVDIDGAKWRLVADDELGVVSAVSFDDPGTCQSWYTYAELDPKAYGFSGLGDTMRGFLGKPSAWKPAEGAPDGRPLLWKHKDSGSISAGPKARESDLSEWLYAEIPE